MIFQGDFNLLDLDYYVEESIEFIKKNLEGKRVFVGFSGGKDSICCAKLMDMSEIKYELYYSFTGIDPPEVVQFIRRYYPNCKFLKPKRTFWSKLSVSRPPSINMRWCCELLKKDPAFTVDYKHRILGIRSEESNSRSKQDRVNKYWLEKKGCIYYYPIFFWKEWVVWEFIEKYNLIYPSLYDEGFSRLGCIICPYVSELTGKGHCIHKKRWPIFYKTWETKVKELWYKRQNEGKDMYHSCPEDFLKEWYLDSKAKWYKSKPKSILEE